MAILLGQIASLSRYDELDVADVRGRHNNIDRRDFREGFGSDQSQRIAAWKHFRKFERSIRQNRYLEVSRRPAAISQKNADRGSSRIEPSHSSAHLDRWKVGRC